MYFKIKNEKTKLIVGEILQRLELVEVKGDSVEHIYIIKKGLNQIFEKVEEVEEDSDKDRRAEEIKKKLSPRKEENETKLEGG